MDQIYTVIPNYRDEFKRVDQTFEQITSDIDDINKKYGELDGKTEEYKKSSKKYIDEKCKEIKDGCGRSEEGVRGKISQVEKDLSKSILSIKKDLRVLEENLSDRFNGLQQDTSKTVEHSRKGSESRIESTEKSIKEIKEHLNKIIEDFTREVGNINALSSKEKKDMEGFMMNIVHHKSPSMDKSDDIKKDMFSLQEGYTSLIEKYKDLILNDTCILNDINELKMCCTKVEAQYQDYIARYVLTAKENILNEISDKIIAIDNNLSESIEDLENRLNEQEKENKETISHLVKNIDILKKEIELLSKHSIKVDTVEVKKAKPRKKVTKKKIVLEKEIPIKKGLFGKIRDIFK